MEKRYEIGGKTYIQRPLVLGQDLQLLNLLEGISLPAGLNSAAIVIMLAGLLPEALAIVLTEEGRPLKDKNIAELATELEFAITREQALTVIEDFLFCNPLDSPLEKIAGLTDRIKAAIPGSKKPSSSSPEETSQDAMTSSGDIPLESASRT